MSAQSAKAANRYAQLLEQIFDSKFTPGAEIVEFTRPDLAIAARKLRIVLPKNLGDVIYSFRYRNALPPTIIKRAPKGRVWIIRGVGRAKYAFVAVQPGRANIVPTPGRAETKIPDGTPGVIVMHALNDEQALLAILRYNRLIDIFTGVTCYSLQSHLRTTAPNVGQVETDEVYVGVDKRGAHYVFPVQAKAGRDRIHVVQIEQDFAMCEVRFPNAVCRPIAAQFMAGDVIALFEFEKDPAGVKVLSEAHYHLVDPELLDSRELAAYAKRKRSI